MTRIRLARMGRHKLPFYHILVMNQKTQRNGKFIEKIGFYDPLKKTEHRSEKVNVKIERYLHWVSTGAQPSETVKKLMGLVIKS